MRRLTPRILCPVAIIAFVFPVAAQDVQVKGAQVTLQPKTVSVEIVTIENRRNSALMAWEIRLDDRKHGGGLFSRADFTLQLLLPPSLTSGPIKPNERRDLEIDANDRDFGSPRIRLAVFEDGYVEGVSEAIELWQKQRQERAEDAAYWMRALEATPAGSEEMARQHLAARVAERAAQASHDPSGIRGRLSGVGDHSSFPAGRLFEMLEPIRSEAKRQHAILTRWPSTHSSLEAPAPVVVSSRRAVMTEHVASVRNLRDVPIEAIGLERIEPGEQRPGSGQVNDYCPIDPATPASGRGPIAPGESREFRLGGAVRDASRLPTVRVAFVIFDDLSFEGSAAQRDTVLRTRERQADEIAFANTARAEAAAKPAGEAVAFLSAKRSERAKELQAQGRPMDFHLLDNLIKEAMASPGGLRENVAAVKELERQRQRLLRHLK